MSATALPAGRVAVAARPMWSNYCFILPALAMFVTFSIYPFGLMGYLSLHEWDGITSSMQFVGVGNFAEVLRFDATWWVSFGNAACITLLALTLQNAVALGLAMALNRELRGAGTAYRVIYYLPPILSGIVVGLVWGWIYDGNFGILNQGLNVIGLGHLARAWLDDPRTALAAVAGIHMWKGFGWGFIIFAAGLQNIPQELYEAAKVDGAGPWERFWHITVPLMMPVFFLVSILTILGTMQIFEVVLATTNGGPGFHTMVPVIWILKWMFGSSRFGYACAMGLVFGIVLLAVSLAQLRVSAWISKRTY